MNTRLRLELLFRGVPYSRLYFFLLLTLLALSRTPVTLGQSQPSSQVSERSQMGFFLWGGGGLLLLEPYSYLNVVGGPFWLETRTRAEPVDEASCVTRGGGGTSIIPQLLTAHTAVGPTRTGLPLCLFSYSGAAMILHIVSF